MTEETDSFQPTKVHAAYIVVINEDGSLNTTLVKPNAPILFEVERATTTYDVFSSSKEIATEIEGQLMADRIARSVISQIMPKDPEAEAKARIASALAERKSEEDNKLGE